MYAKSAQTINSILAVAGELFTAKNYADVTVAEIARAAEVTKGALYHHFPSKEALYVAMMLRSLEEVRSLQEEVLRSGSGSCRERLRQSVLSFMRLPDETRRVVSLVRRDINIFKDPTRKRLIRAYQSALPERVEAVIRDGIANGEIADFDARLLSWGHVALVEVVLRPYGDAVFKTAQEKAEFLTRLFFDGVAEATRGQKERAWHVA